MAGCHRAGNLLYSMSHSFSTPGFPSHTRSFRLCTLKLIQTAAGQRHTPWVQYCTSRIRYSSPRRLWKWNRSVQNNQVFTAALTALWGALKEWPEDRSRIYLLLCAQSPSDWLANPDDEGRMKRYGMQVLLDEWWLTPSEIWTFFSWACGERGHATANRYNLWTRDQDCCISEYCARNCVQNHFPFTKIEIASGWVRRWNIRYIAKSSTSRYAASYTSHDKQSSTKY